MILLTSFYQSPHPERNAELQECWNRNEQCAALSLIYRFVESDFKDHKWSPCVKNNIVPVERGKRMTFAQYFNFANEKFADGTPVVVANADIWFDETLANVNEQNLDRKTVFACSRWGFWNDKPTWHWDEGYSVSALVSQDAWIFRTPVQWKRPLDFTPGCPGCDNALAHAFQDAGYKVINPTEPGPKSLKLHHEHRSQKSNYGPLVPGPYVYVPPCQLK